MFDLEDENCHTYCEMLNHIIIKKIRTVSLYRNSEIFKFGLVRVIEHIFELAWVRQIQKLKKNFMEKKRKKV